MNPSENIKHEPVYTCDWGFTFDAMKTYHDTEWGVPVHDDRRMFEHLMMEAMQCGLSWSLRRISNGSCIPRA